MTHLWDFLHSRTQRASKGVPALLLGWSQRLFWKHGRVRRKGHYVLGVGVRKKVAVKRNPSQLQQR